MKSTVVAGASAGIGEATVRALRAQRWAVLAGARRTDLLEAPAEETGCVIAPLDVDTEFSLVRFDGDAEPANMPYAGMTPLTAGDVAEVVVWAATRHSHVNIDDMAVQPRDQARATTVHRRTT